MVKISISLGALMGLFATAAFASPPVTLAKYGSQLKTCIDLHILSRLVPECAPTKHKGAALLAQVNPKSGDFLFVKRCKEHSNSSRETSVYIYQAGKQVKVRISNPWSDINRRLKLDHALPAAHFHEVNLAYVTEGKEQGSVDREHSILSDPDYPVFMAVEPYPETTLLWDDEGQQASAYKLNLRDFGECTSDGL